MKNIIEVEKINKVYSNKEKILTDVCLEIKENTFNVLLGQSGSGKSTLLNVMSGLLSPTSGKVYINSNDITGLDEKQLAYIRRNYISNIYQDYMLLSELTVKENIELGMGCENMDFNEIIHLLGIEKQINKFPAQLSGGQRQRVSIARAIIKKPHILFCDEATGALDENSSKQVVELLHNIKNKYGVTIIFATHNLKIAKTADRVITIKDGKLIKDYNNENPIPPLKLNWGIE